MRRTTLHSRDTKSLSQGLRRLDSDDRFGLSKFLASYFPRPFFADHNYFCANPLLEDALLEMEFSGFAKGVPYENDEPIQPDRSAGCPVGSWWRVSRPVTVNTIELVEA